MPLYYFDLWDGQRFHFDNAGVEWPGPEDAFDEVVRDARVMLRAAALKRQGLSGWAYQVRDEVGRTLFSLPFSIAGIDQHYVRPRPMKGCSDSRRRKGSHPLR